MTTGKDEIFYSEFAATEIKVTRGNVKKSMGYPADVPNTLVDELIDSYLIKMENFIQPSGGFRIIDRKDFSLETDCFNAGGNHFYSGKIIAGQLKKCESIAVFAVTAGRGIDELVKKLTLEDETLAAFIVNTIGSEAAEETAGAIELILGNVLVDKGWSHTNRFSPGYCDWSVGEQHLLFSLLPEGFAGIKLTDSALMTPIKSISGIIGIGPFAKKKEYICSICDFDNCFRRKTNG